jgi:LuxR family maltose regulon positive regulatory protein
VRPGIVQRDDLVQTLVDASELVAVVVAPPGYGKTTLLAQWAERDRRPFTWLSVDRRCNDPAVLLSALAVALAQVVPVDAVVFDHLAAAHRLQREAVVAGLASAVAMAPGPFVLVLDDAHLLIDPEGLDAVSTVLGHLPWGSQLALGGRREPRLGLPRLRGEGRVLDIGPEALRLDATGAQELLTAAGADELGEGDLDGLLAATEGWPIGLYFAALARRSAALPPVHPREFTGDDRLLADYIRAEFLDRLPADRLQFLVRSSVLDELSGPLCDAVLQQAGSANVLEEVEASNLLLVPLDRQRQWYRYHHLFGALLRHELDRTEPDAVPELTLRASRWYEADGQFDAAVHYAQLAGDVRRVGEILRRGGMRQFAGGRLSTLRGLFGWLADRDALDPGVAILGAAMSALSGQAAEADSWAELARKGDLTAEQPDGSPVEAWVLALGAVMGRDSGQMRRQAGRALELLSPTSNWRGGAAMNLGLAEFLDGDLDAADRTLAGAVVTGLQVGALPSLASALAARAVIAIRRDSWPAAEGLIEQAAEVIETGHLHSYPPIALNHAVSARAAVHRRDHRTARAELSSASRLLPTLTRAFPAVAVLARLELARAAIGCGDLPAATTLLADAQQLLAGDMDFPSLQEDSDDLAAAIARLRTSANGPVPLTPAELRVLPLLATQYTFREIADRLFVSVHTVKAQVTSIYRKLGASSRTQAVDHARSTGLL